MANPLKTRLAHLLLVALILAACAPKPKPPLVRLYESRQETLEGLDLRSIQGRTIVIDPGHGGTFRGARGVGGLDEADVNLGVALYLWGLLEEAGAEVVLTRRTDRDFVDRDSLELRNDLQARVDIVEQVDPDVFISLHHNADVARDTTFNEIQVYYKMSDRGPSLDIARIVARHLLKNIGEPKTRVVPGNYYVLRNSSVPSILCEPSYITNTRVESKLKLSNKQRLEAEVYFLALVDYFSRGVPGIIAFAPVGVNMTGTPIIRVDFDDVSLIDAPTVAIYLDDTRLTPFKVGPNSFAAFPTTPLSSGEHTVRASGRAMRGNSSPEFEWDFLVALEPEVLTLSATPAAARPPYPQKLSATVLDTNGNPVADSTGVVFTWKGKTFEKPTIDGTASVHVGREIPFETDIIAVSCKGLEERLVLSTVDSQSAQEHAGQYVSGFIRDKGGKPVDAATVTTVPLGQLGFSDRDGYFLIEWDSRAYQLHVFKPGFKDVVVDLTGDTPVVTLDRFYHSLASEAVIALDARGGGDETGWVGPAGTKASDLNLALAKRIAGFLSSVGVSTCLTRETDTKITEEDRVMRCEVWNSTVVVSVSHIGSSRKGVRIEHYPGSRGGIRLSEHLSQEMKSTTDYPPEVGETAQYIIQQTSCPAVKITFATPGTLDDEAILSEPADLWMRAYAAFCAIVRYLGVEEHATFSISGRVTKNGEPCTDALVVIDGSFETIIDQAGEFRLKLLEPGLHTVRVFSGTASSNRVTFDEHTESIRITLD